MNGLVVRDVYAGYDQVRVLHGVSLAVAGSETLALLGPNGSGKSTLVKTVMGLSTLHGGTVRWEGRELTRLPTWRRTRAGIAYVPQVDGTFARLDVRENLMLAASGCSKPVLRERLELVLELFPRLAERRRVIAGRLSGGERRMLGIGSALMGEPKLLILDEPTTDLAPAAIDALFERLLAIRSMLALPLLLVEQNVPRALELADRVCVLVAGSVVLETPGTCVSEDELADIFLQHL